MHNASHTRWFCRGIFFSIVEQAVIEKNGERVLRQRRDVSKVKSPPVWWRVVQCSGLA